MSEANQPIDELTTREAEILALLAEGLSDREIADRLTVAYTTVKWYNRQIFNKLGVKNRHQAIERGKNLNLLPSASPTHDVKSSLPGQTTRFVGRTQELATLTRMLHEGESRLITILAPGGMGKTRLALAAAEAVFVHFPNGAFFVPLAPLTASEQMISTIAEYTGFQFSSDSRTPKQQLLDFFREKAILLILDNFEHLLDGAPLITDILQSAPNAVVVVTSRERLNLSSETIYLLGGMAYPEKTDGEHLSDYSALRLFEQCARRMQPNFSLESDAKNAARMCQLVQGMPLAIELAAAWVNTLSLAEIAGEIRHNLDFLQTTMGDVPERLRSIRTVFESSWKRLDEREQTVFRRLSVFRGGCTREAAQSVATADLETLTGLINKALLWRIPDSGRYEVHELLRQYGEEQLEHSGEGEATRDAHSAYFAECSRHWEEALKGQQQRETIKIIEADIENIRQAVQRCIDYGNLDLTGDFTGIRFFFVVRGRWQEGRALFAPAVERFEGEETTAYGKILLLQAEFAFRSWSLNEAEAYSLKSLEIFQRYGDGSDKALALLSLGSIRFSMTEPSEAIENLFREALAAAPDDPRIVGTVFHFLGLMAQLRNDFPTSEQFFKKALAVHEKSGNVWGQTFNLYNLGQLALWRQDYRQARGHFQENLRRARDIQMPLMIAGSLTNLGEVGLAEDHYDEARRLFEEGLKIDRETGNWISVSGSLDSLGRVAFAEQKYLEAQQYFQQALKIAHELLDKNQIAFIMLHYVELMHGQSQLVQAVEMGALIQPFFRGNAHDESIHRAIMKKLETDLKPELYAAALERGKALELEAIVAELLAE